MFYTGQQKAGFCTISESKRQDAAAIWTYMDQILTDIHIRYPAINTIHFWSDGPSKQYKNKKNFFLLCVVLQRLGFEKATWNFFPTSHGKGAPDGIGATVKRCADSIVLRGQDIIDGKLFFDKVSNSLSGVKLQFVTNEDFQSYDSLLLQTLKSIPGTRNIHQVLAQGNVIHCRFLSCFCGEPQICKCFSPTIHSFGNTTQDPDVHESSTTAKVQNPLEMLMEEMEKEPSKTPKGTTTLIDPCDVQSEDWLVVMYDGKWWLAKALQIDKEHEDVQVEFFHPHGPTLSFKQKQGRRDICFVPFSDVLVRLRKPSSPVHTSSTRGVYRISPAVMDFIEGEYVTRLLPGD
ncbi:uncharacterized protein LOC111605902 [Xiphophorus maculatus]|uniref:uncharacterized protein LOC111605902 n=1 Tax=Xiphophorus maculatus TaxID=8083 RepID=UPI000C6D2B0D|nr:uncharacterized protein LOC111605902 [Xiphophorus maculatus]